MTTMQSCISSLILVVVTYGEEYEAHLYGKSEKLTHLEGA